MNKIPLTVTEIHELAKSAMLTNGCDEANAEAVAITVSTAERDGSESHGLFRIPGYVASLRSGKVNGKANPTVKKVTPAILKVHGDEGYAPLAIERGVPALAEAAKEIGIAALGITNTYHFAALWPETEALAEQGLVGLACTAYKPSVAPAGAKKALFGTNPISFAWPRPGMPPLVYDMATAAKALGDVQIAARDGHDVPLTFMSRAAYVPPPVSTFVVVVLSPICPTFPSMFGPPPVFTVLSPIVMSPSRSPPTATPPCPAATPPPVATAPLPVFVIISPICPTSPPMTGPVTSPVTFI
jgi:hypothetical protein